MLKDTLIAAAKKHAEAEIDLHKANIEVYMQQVVGIGEHSDIIETIAFWGAAYIAIMVIVVGLSEGDE